MNSGWGWNQTSGITWSSGSTAATIYPNTISVTPPLVLPGVMESPATELGDREWLDAQIAEVCGLAT